MVRMSSNNNKLPIDFHQVGESTLLQQEGAVPEGSLAGRGPDGKRVGTDYATVELPSIEQPAAIKS